MISASMILALWPFSIKHKQRQYLWTVTMTLSRNFLDLAFYSTLPWLCEFSAEEEAVMAGLDILPLTSYVKI
jgi:hypothetical protein